MSLPFDLVGPRAAGVTLSANEYARYSRHLLLPEVGLDDFDLVDFSNLQRQVLHGTPDVGRPKLHSARDRILAINPEVRVDLYEARLTSANAFDIFRPYDVIIDGTDN